ncbi:MAG: hypothetical protein KTR26_07135 [Flammeovirgaceae bacterium]|nr:hypothetical protein [Flammeovirgaceae bacterium]
MLKKVIISRTDNLGDVILTLPLTGFLKLKYPELNILFIGKKYTESIINTSQNVDEFLDREEIIKTGKLPDADAIIFVFPDKDLASIAKKSKIKTRIGTSHRLFHWLFCNKLINFSRKKSDLHEAQLNFKLFKGLNLETEVQQEDLAQFFNLKAKPLQNPEVEKLINPEKTNLILHPKSKGSAREWPMESYQNLVEHLPKDKFNFFISGTHDEGLKIKAENNEIFGLENVIDITGKFSLEEFISFIDLTQGLIACSTGPLHIAAGLGKFALGIYPSNRPMHPGRWAPIGEKATFIEADEVVGKGMESDDVTLITPEMIAKKVMEAFNFH